MKLGRNVPFQTTEEAKVRLIPALVEHKAIDHVVRKRRLITV